jgi:lipoprotein-anchoring transpeptidase ErfK/SrfK
MRLVPRSRLAALVLAAAFLGLVTAATRTGFSTAALDETGVPAVGATTVSVAEQEPRPASDPPDAVPPDKSAAKPKRHAAGGSITARLRAGASVAVHRRPGGVVLATLGPVTEFGSPQTLAVVERRGAWLGVVTTALANGEVGWIRADRGSLRLGRTGVRITVDLSARRLTLVEGGRVVRRIEVGVGRPGSPTPVGLFAVTDKLPGSRYGSYYGCCILALSAHQPNLPAGWTGGDRMAIHGTSDPGSVGAARSAGCLRADDEELRVLMRRVPLGTPVLIRG